MQFLRRKAILYGVGSILVGLACFCLVPKPNASGPIIISSAAGAPATIDGLETICHLHRRMYASSPAQEPETFFEVLGINAFAPPFDTQGTWLKASNKQHHQAKDLIRQKWAEKRLRLRREGPRDVDTKMEEKHLDLVANLLVSSLHSKAYILFVMPEIANIRGERRLKALQKLCKNHWTANVA
ncbi:hypothetical protein G7046_g8452 [Stylonectria norvegica]|nr:hypothetical protein G7046_g8452 [Stylonectria norvegica]